MSNVNDQRSGGLAVASLEQHGFYTHEISDFEIERTPGQAVHVQGVGLGYSGTKKLSHMLNVPDCGFHFRHEWYWRATGPLGPQFYDDQVEQIRRGEVSFDDLREFYAPYFDEVKTACRMYRVVGDSHGWPIDLVPLIDQEAPIHAVIHLVRNGLRFVWSMLNWNARHAGNLEAWESVCVSWSRNTLYHDPDTPWIAGLGRPLRSYRIEDLTGESGCGTDALQNLIHWLDPAAEVADEVLRAKQQGHINKHDPKSELRTTEWVWSQLNDEQRDAFVRRCAEAMQAFGYEMPK